MSRGVGQLQRRILVELAQPHDPAYRFVVDIANELFPPRASRSRLVSIRRALDSLGQRRLVWTRYEGTSQECGLCCGLPWSRLPQDHHEPGRCQCCPGGQDSFRATLDHAGARRLLGLGPAPTPAAPLSADLPPAGRTLVRIALDPLGDALVVAMKTASRATGLAATGSSPGYGLWPCRDHLIADGWVPHRWASAYIQQAVRRQYQVAPGRAAKVAARVLNGLLAAERVEVRAVEREPKEPGILPHIFLRSTDKCCLGTPVNTKATLNEEQG